MRKRLELMDEVTGTMIASKTHSNQMARTWPSFVPEKAPLKGSSNWRKMIIVLWSFFECSQRIRYDEYTKKATIAHGYLFDFIKKMRLLRPGI